MSEKVTKDELLGGRVPITEMASALGYKSVRPVRELVQKLHIPYVVIDRMPHVMPQVFREALEREQMNAPPRGRGRRRNPA